LSVAASVPKGKTETQKRFIGEVASPDTRQQHNKNVRYSLNEQTDSHSGALQKEEGEAGKMDRR